MPSLNGFSISSSPSAIGIKTYKVPGTSGVYLPVRAEVAPLLIGAAAEWHRYVEPLVPGWNWGWAYREVTGGSSWSFHAPGIAIDLNAPRHPYNRSGTMGSGDADRVRRIARKYGLRWGGDYSGPNDEMHLEVILSRSAALDLVRRLGGSVATARTGDLVSTLKDLKAGDSGHQVYVLQRVLQITDDGDFGGGTKSAVVAFQKAKDLTADGIVGERTWRALLLGGKSALRTLDEGDAGHQVAVIQRVLQITDDGEYGPGTKTAVRAFQKRKGLTADGITGGRTWDALLTGSA